MTQKLFRYLPLLFSVALVFSACKKEKDQLEELTQPDAEVAVHYDDEAMVSEEIDAIADEANALFESNPVLAGNNSVVEEPICDATVTADFVSDPMTITVVFNGADCATKRTRTGTMILSAPKGTEWKNAGAAITITFDNLKITRKDGKSITINGSKVYTNVSGGLVHEVANSGPVVHSIQSVDLSIKFDDGTARTWNIARKKEFSYENGLVISVIGTHEEDDKAHIAEWGTNRFGNAFVTSIESPVVVKQECSFRVTGGQIVHSTDVFTATATFGLDASGNQTTCPGEGKYYYKLGWTRTSNGNSFSVLLPY